MTTYKINGPDEPFEFEGELIASVSTRYSQNDPRPRPRWLAMDLYQVATGGYLLHRTGGSTVYHVKGKMCASKGDLVTHRQLPAEATRCAEAPTMKFPVCSPPWPDELYHDEQVVLEQPQFTINFCLDADSVIQRASRHKPGSAGSMAITGPARRLMEAAAERDPEFQAMLRSMIRPPATQFG